MHERSESQGVLQGRFHGFCFHKPMLGLDRIYHKPVVHWTGGGGIKKTVPLTELTDITIAELNELLADHAATEEQLVKAGIKCLRLPDQTNQETLLRVYLNNLQTLEPLPDLIKERDMHQPALVVKEAIKKLTINF